MTLNELSETVASGDNYMRFSHLQLENWRNFTHVDVVLQQRAFLIGANATGKSNLLDVFRFLRDIVRVGGGFEKAVEDRGGVSRLYSLFASGVPHIVIDIQMEGDNTPKWRYRLAFTQDTNSPGRPILTEEKVWESENLLLDRPDEQDASDEELLRRTRLEQIIANRKYREIADFFNSIRYYHIVPQIVREPERSVGQTFDPYGSDFIEQIAQLPFEKHQALIKSIEEVLHLVVPQFREIMIRPDSRGVLHMFGRYESNQPNAGWQTEANFSDGTLRLIGLVRALLDGDGPLLLEEPELSLHSAIIRYLPGMMWSIQKRHSRQILISTHSSDLLLDEGISSDEVMLLLDNGVGKGTEVKLGFEIATVKHLLDAGLPVAEAALPQTQPAQAQQLLYLGDHLDE